MPDGFDDREKNYEAKWAHDADLRFRTTARRNKLLGLWAATQMGLSGVAAESYANTLLELEVKGARDADIAQKIREDFDAHKLTLSDHLIHRKMEELLAEAGEQVMHEQKQG
jgi:hypothetical protein